MKLTEAVKACGKTAIVFGESGVGKTHFLGTLPGRTLIIAAEFDGIKCLVKSRNIENIEIEKLPRTTMEINKYFDNLLIREDRFDTICLDSATELDKYLMMEKTDPNRNGGIPAQRTYLEVQYTIRRCLRKLRDLANERGTNVVITALEQPQTLSQDGETELSKAYPLISTRKFPPEACGLVDFVAHLEIAGNGSRYMRLESTDRIEAKDRIWGRKVITADGEILFNGKTGNENND